jgi:hypothetical protein
MNLPVDIQYPLNPFLYRVTPEMLTSGLDGLGDVINNVHAAFPLRPIIPKLLLQDTAIAGEKAKEVISLSVAYIYLISV